MADNLRVLIVDDSEADAELVAHELEAADADVAARRVDNEADMREALSTGAWDAILADYEMPGFSVAEALAIAQEYDQDLPFIVVSGVIRIEDAVSLLQAGAHDFIEKDRLARLNPALERALSEAESRRERRKAEARLRESEERLRAISSAAPVAFVVCPLTDGTILYANPRAGEYLDVPERDLVGRSILDFVPSPEARGAFEKSLRAPESGIDGEIEMQSATGSRFPALTTIQAIAFDGEPGVLFSFFDIAERKKHEETMHQAQKMQAIGQLTSGVAHDFNNILMVVLANAREIGEQVGENHPHREPLDDLIGAATRAADLTRRLLAFSRKQALEPKVIDPYRLVRDMSEMLVRTIGEHIEIKIGTRDSAWATRVDPGQLENAILNLAINARDAMPQGGTLRIETSNLRVSDNGGLGTSGLSPGDYTVISVSDTGDGMPPEVAERAFEPFFTTKGLGMGTGLGLSMVYGFVTQSGGDVRLSSEPGAGTTIELYLPRSLDRVAAERDASSPTAPAARGETVLVVEDDADVRAIAVRFLRTLGYKVVQAEDGETALVALQEPSGVDLLFTDVVLSGSLNGVDVAEEARRKQPGIKVLYMSGYTDDALSVRGRLQEGARLLDKPFGREDLARVVRTTLDAPAL